MYFDENLVICHIFKAVKKWIERQVRNRMPSLILHIHKRYYSGRRNRKDEVIINNGSLRIAHTGLKTNKEPPPPKKKKKKKDKKQKQNKTDKTNHLPQFVICVQEVTIDCCIFFIELDFLDIR